MEIKISKLGDKAQELLTQIAFAKNQTEDSREVNLKRYQDSWMYYRSLLPQKGKHELSSYVEPVLYEAVSNIRPSLLNVFTENEEQAVIFRPQTTQINKLVVDAVNKRINDIFLRENEGKRIMGDVFTEGLVTGDTFIKFYVEEYPTEQNQEFEDWVPQMMMDMLTEMWPQSDFSKMETKEDIFNKVPTVFYKGTAKLKRVDQMPIVEHVSQADLYIDDKTSTDIANARYVGHRRVITVGDAFDLGYDKNIIEGATTYDFAADDIAMSTRNLVIEKTITDNQQDTICIDENERKIVVWEHYIYSSIPSKDNKTRLYQVVATDNDLISVKVVSRIPFCHGVPESVPGSFWGGSMYDRVKNLQDLLSILERNRLQTSVNMSYPRYTAMRGKYDRASLLDFRPGGVVEIDEPTAVGFLMPPSSDINNISVSLNDLRGQKDRIISTSVGSLVSGGALNNAAASTVAMTLANEEMKDAVIAKSFAWTLVKPLFELMYETIREIDMPIPVDDPSGQMPMLNGGSLPPRPDFTIDINTANDDSIKAMSLTQILTLIAQTAAMPIPLIDGQKAYNIAAELCKLQGIDNPEDFFLDPSKAPEPTPEEQQAQAEQAQQDAAAKQIAMDLQEAQVQLAAINALRAEKEIEEMLKNGAINREKEAEMLKIKYEELALKRMETELDYNKYQAQLEAMQADIELTSQLGTGVDITVPR